MKVLIVDDHALFRAGLRMLLSTIGPQVDTFEADSVAQALAFLPARHDVLLCLLDLSFEHTFEVDAIERVKQVAPWIAVVVVSGTDDGATIRNCIDAGAMSFIPKSVPPEVLTKAMQHVLAGNIYLPEQVYASMQDAPLVALTPRQLDVLRCMSKGLPTKLISRDLGLSEYTVRDHISAIFLALGARNRTDAVIKASQLGVLRGSAVVGH